MTTDTIALTVVHVAGLGDLFRRYDGQTNAQNAYLKLDLETGEFTADYDPNLGGYPEAVYRNRRLTWQIPTLTAEAANRSLDSLAPLARRILDGSAIVLDRNSNLIGQLDDDATAASDEIQDLCQGMLNGGVADTDLVGEVDAYDWFEYELPEGFNAKTTDAQIAVMVAQAEKEALTVGDMPQILTGAEEYLQDKRDGLAADADED